MNTDASNDETSNKRLELRTVGKFILRKNYQKNLDNANKQKLNMTKRVTEEDYEDRPQEWKRVLSSANLKLSSKIGLDRKGSNCEKKNLIYNYKNSTNKLKNSMRDSKTKLGCQTDTSFDNHSIRRQVSARVLSINKNKLIPKLNSSMQKEKFIDRKFSKYTKKLDNIIIESDSNIFIEPQECKNKPKRIKQQNMNTAAIYTKKKNSSNNNQIRGILNKNTEGCEYQEMTIKLHKGKNNNSSYNLLKNSAHNSSFKRDTSELKNGRIKDNNTKSKNNFHKTINSYDKIPNTATNFYTSKNKLNSYNYRHEEANDSQKETKSNKNYTFICKLNNRKISDISESNYKGFDYSNNKTRAPAKVSNLRGMNRDQFCITPIGEVRNENCKKRSVSVSRPKEDLYCKLNSSLSTAETSNIFRGRIDDYIIGKELGKGAYAVVNSCIHKPTNKKLAVKIYNKIKLNDIHKRNTVKREIEVLKKIEHQNIVKLHEVIETIKQVFLVYT